MPVAISRVERALDKNDQRLLRLMTKRVAVALRFQKDIRASSGLTRDRGSICFGRLIVAGRHNRTSPTSIDFSDPSTIKALVRFTERGAKAHCPFCKGRRISRVSSGERIIFLKGMFAGQEATVSDEPGLDESEFLVKFDDQQEGWGTSVSYKRDAFGRVPIEVPDWLCSLSIDDLCAIDGAALHMALIRQAEPLWSSKTLMPLISVVRQRRLPVTADDLWLTLRSHGFARKLKPDFLRLFDFSIELLISLNRRPPIKKKRVAPMSIGRY
jgi:hypothetical protein